MGPRDAADELAALSQELDLPDVAPVCVTHMRVVPCRRDDGCVISEDQADVDRVHAWQRGER